MYYRFKVNIFKYTEISFFVKAESEEAAILKTKKHMTHCIKNGDFNISSIKPKPKKHDHEKHLD